MNKIIIALGIALASSTAALAQSSALDVVGQQFTVSAQAVDYEATASIGSADLGVEAAQNRGKLGDGSPMFGNTAAGSVAVETGYLPADRLGGNS